jgi:hypothetical protein
MTKNPLKFFLLGFAGMALSVLAPKVFAGQLTLGAQYDGWTTNFINPVNGTEFWFPYSVSFNLGPDLNVYGQGEYGIGSYTPASPSDPSTANLSDFSDTLIGSQVRFKSFGLPALLNVGVYIPTGDSTWEGKQSTSNIPLEFMGSRYTGEGFGVNALLGLSFPSGTGEFGAAAGYSNMESYSSDLPGITGPYKPGDAMFLALNHVQPYSNNQSEIIRLTGFAYLPTQVDSQNSFQLGPSLALAYSWLNPKELSFEVGGQYYLPMNRANTNGNLVPEADEFLAPRLYLNPSYAFGNFSLAASLSYVFQNSYSEGNTYYDGGGFLAGLSPSYKLKLDGTSDLKLTGAYYFIDHHNGFPDIAGNLVDVDYSLFSFGATYEVRL